MNSAMHTSGDGHQENDRESSIMVYCRMFTDFVPMHICTLRKRELNSFGWNSCSGCAIGLVGSWIDTRIAGKDQQIL